MLYTPQYLRNSTGCFVMKLGNTCLYCKCRIKSTGNDVISKSIFANKLFACPRFYHIKKFYQTVIENSKNSHTFTTGTTLRVEVYSFSRKSGKSGQFFILLVSYSHFIHEIQNWFELQYLLKYQLNNLRFNIKFNYIGYIL